MFVTHLQTSAYAENSVPMMPMIPTDPYQHQQQLQQPMSLPPTTNINQIDQEFTQINRDIQNLSLQYENQPYDYENSTGEVSPNQTTDANSIGYADQTHQYPQQNAYEPQQPTDFHGQPPQQTDIYGQPQQNESGAYSEQHIPQTGYTEQQQMYQQPSSYRDPFRYGAASYGNAEVNS